MPPRLGLSLVGWPSLKGSQLCRAGTGELRPCHLPQRKDKSLGLDFPSSYPVSWFPPTSDLAGPHFSTSEDTWPPRNMKRKDSAEGVPQAGPRCSRGNQTSGSQPS